eukprot:TRINITY_DN13590_c0_g1_i5.p1 TRINITY_DN13590_c0_g1~~TRINITY_DN13590_c0_g1_i5.p1  ORF type:complete len:123 (-),score=45.29 TRINITY_DN13590_c0_g1_i5:161-529(-)
MIRRPPRSTQGVSSAASDVYKRQYQRRVHGKFNKMEEKKEEKQELQKNYLSEIQEKQGMILGSLINASEAIEQFNKISKVHIKAAQEDYARHKTTVKEICNNFLEIQTTIEKIRSFYNVKQQ